MVERKECQKCNNENVATYTKLCKECENKFMEEHHKEVDENMEETYKSIKKGMY